MKKVLSVILIILLVVILAAAALIAWLSVTEFRPDAVEDVEVNSSVESGALSANSTLDIVTWNVGYGGLDAEADFFMDGGTQVSPEDQETVNKNLDGIKSTINDLGVDIALLQEVDIDSKRTFGINEAEMLNRSCYTNALNYSCGFVPYPWPPIGRVNSGLMTTTEQLLIDSAQRISLPCPFSWPVSTANLKRCLLVSYIPVEDSGNQLVLVNLHLEAYDSGEGKIAQTKQLVDFVTAEYEKGNYVIAGGDFNQVFPGSYDAYPNTHPELWTPGTIEASGFPEGWTLAYDLSIPTCRLLNQPYDPADTLNTQYYVIDGFILSPNVQLNEVKGIDAAFEYSDHNPVLLNVTLK